MRVSGPNGLSAPTTAAPRRAGTTSFSLGEAEQARAGAQSSAPRGVGNIDALIALQGVDDATQKRRRAVKRGRSALDALDALKLGLLAGRLDGLSVARLRAAAADLPESSGDPALDAILGEIELRVGVELAKIGMPRP